MGVSRHLSRSDRARIAGKHASGLHDVRTDRRRYGSERVGLCQTAEGTPCVAAGYGTVEVRRRHPDSQNSHPLIWSDLPTSCPDSFGASV